MHAGRSASSFPALALLAPLALSACDGDGAPVSDGLPDPPPAGTWIAIEPGGDTLCSRGTPYRFFVRGGRPDRVMVDFQGGGACWDEVTCGAAGVIGLFTEDVGTLEEFVGFVETSGQGGYLSDAPENPFRDWTVVHVPYCTGDIHWGDARTTYGSDAIEHRGFVNASAALDWMYRRFRDPSNVFVSGCSAGAYGAALHSAYLAQHYPDAQVSVFADSGAGIITESFLVDSLPNWNAQANLPSFVPGLDVPLTELSLAEVYIRIGERFPAMRLAQQSTHYDQDQVFFYTAMGGTRTDWPPAMRASHERIAAAIPNFTSYVPGGSMHCAGIYPFFTEREVDGTSLSDWTEQLAVGEAQPPRVGCSGASCCEDPVCDECGALPEADRPSYCRFCARWPADWPECAMP